MSFLDAFKRRKPELAELTSQESLMDIKTLDQALEKIGALTTQIQGLETSITDRDASIASLNSDLQVCMEGFGITKKVTDTDGVTHWESSQVNTLKASVTDLTAERDEVQGQLTAANTRIADLEKAQKTVSARALEFLASQGGKPLPVSASGTQKPNSREQLSEAMDAANRAGNQEELKRLYAEYRNLKK